MWQSSKQERGCLVHFVRLATMHTATDSGVDPGGARGAIAPQ